MSPDAGWWTDPTGRHLRRYWDGTQWTDHVADGGPTTVETLGLAPPVTDVIGSSQPEAPARACANVAVCTAVALLLLVTLAPGYTQSELTERTTCDEPQTFVDPSACERPTTFRIGDTWYDLSGATRASRSSCSPSCTGQWRSDSSAPRWASGSSACAS